MRISSDCRGGSGHRRSEGKDSGCKCYHESCEISEFPDNATDVIWQYIDGVAQFSPIADGRISEVVPSDETKEAVKQALEGVDYSDGALFFIQRSAAAKNNIQWFDKNLKKLFKHGVHEFYTYPEAAQQ